MKRAILALLFAMTSANLVLAKPGLSRLQPTNIAKPFTKQERQFFGGNCSWYCGAPAIRVSATSALTERNGFEHPAQHGHDRKLNTAWCVHGMGTGEKLTFEFVTTKQDTTRLAVTSCGIVAGYQATEKLFRQNARPKTLQLFIDGRPLALLELQDSMGIQNFSLPKLRLERPSRHTISFEILDTYPGTKFQDTCITEINFSGEGDMH
ncbi:MAG TPA: hypothetical protein VFG14_00135 [Chthoniobacteraceae bacterium]|nr:hypothetical protein [Chthoniobacteraceae bacterium]